MRRGATGDAAAWVAAVCVRVAGLGEWAKSLGSFFASIAHQGQKRAPNGMAWFVFAEHGASIRRCSIRARAHSFADGRELEPNATWKFLIKVGDSRSAGPSPVISKMLGFGGLFDKICAF